MPKKKGGKKGKKKDSVPDEIQQLKAEEEQKRREELLKTRLREMQEEESRLTKINNLIVHNRWRTILRAAKVEELKKEIEVLAQCHDRQVDRKDAVIQMLSADLEEAEEQYNVALRSHLQNVDSLITLQHSRVEALEQQFEYHLTELSREFDEERLQIQEHHTREKEEMVSIINAMKSEAESMEDDARQEFQSHLDELRNRNTEEYNVLKITLEGIIEDYNQLIREEHQKYIASTEDKMKDYQIKIQKDQQTAKTIENQIRKIQRLQEALAHWKAKLANNIKECEERNEALRKEKESMSKHFKALKKQMTAFRESEERRLTDLVSNARHAIKKLEEMLERGERILKMAELNRRLETEREKVLPFAGAVLSPAGASGADGEFLDPALQQELEEMQAETPQEEWEYLENFYKKFNKVLLDKLAIEQEKYQLETENGKLRQLLKQYLDGISVNQDVLSSSNPLLVINHRSNLPQPTRPLPPVQPTVVEAQFVYQYVRSS